VSEPIVVLAAVRAGEAQAARDAVEALDEPFAGVPGTHLARLQVLRPPARRFRGRTRGYVLLAADIDGPASDWLAAAARVLEPVLAHCAFWPGAAGAEEVVRWARERELAVGFSVVGSPEATVEDVRRALRLRDGVRRLVAAELDDAALVEAWRRL
jgi:hypothetical protein